MTFFQKSIGKCMFWNRFVKGVREIEKALVDEFRRLTGLNGGDISEKFGVRRQFVHHTLNNHSLTYRASSAFLLNSMIGEKISSLKKQVQDLEYLQLSIEGSVNNVITKEDLD